MDVDHDVGDALAKRLEDAPTAGPAAKFAGMIAKGPSELDYGGVVSGPMSMVRKK